MRASRKGTLRTAALVIFLMLSTSAVAASGNSSGTSKFTFATVLDYVSLVGAKEDSERSVAFGPDASKAANALPALIWNPYQSPSGDSLEVTLLLAGYIANQVTDLTPYLDMLSDYCLFVMGGDFDGSGSFITPEDMASYLPSILTFLASGGAIYWEGPSSLYFQDEELYNYFGYDILTCITYPFSYLCGTDTFFTEIESIGYDLGYPTPAIEPLNYEFGRVMIAPESDCYGKAVVAHNSALTMVTSFSWAKLHDNLANTRVDLMHAVMSWLSLNTDIGERPIPYEFTLSQNYPNPFNAYTSISFSVPNDGRLSLAVFNIKGQRVKTLLDGFVQAGRKTVLWDGTNEDGKPVASGIYYYLLSSESGVEARKMTLLK